MNFTPAQKKEFEQLSGQMMDFIKTHCHPHCTVIVDSSSAELSEGVLCNQTTTVSTSA